MLRWSRAALAVYRDGKVEAWAATQNPQGARDAIAQGRGLEKGRCDGQRDAAGGAFGRKSFPRFRGRSAVLSKKTGKPVKVIWSREDDIKFDVYHSVAAMYMKAALGRMESRCLATENGFPRPSDRRSTGRKLFGPGELGLGFTDVPFAVANLRAENGPGDGARSNGWFDRSPTSITRSHSFVCRRAGSCAGKDSVEYCCNCSGGPDYSQERNR